jgi:hypothetical protein
MEWLKVLQIASGITTLIGLCAFIAVIYLWYASRQKERSLREVVAGEGVVRPESVVDILKQFTSDSARMEALQRILGYDKRLSERIVAKVSNVDVGSFATGQQQLWTRRLLVVGSVLLLLSLVAAIYSRSEITKGPSGQQTNARRKPKLDKIPQAIVGGGGQFTFELDDTFIDWYRDRATINPNILVDVVGHVHSPQTDGDLHVSGRAEEVLLPVVAEMMNASHRPDAVRKFQDAMQMKSVVLISGAWRLWVERPGGDAQEQGTELTPMSTSAPEHVFEVHPVTRVGNTWVGDTLRPIEGFQPKDANRAFQFYGRLLCDIARDPEKGTTTISTSRAAYNYVEFVMKLDKDPTELQDGHSVRASAYNLSGELLTTDIPMISIKDTDPDKQLMDKRAGERMHVLGVPRISLGIVRNLTGRHPLPYEMIIVAVYPDS